QSCKSIQNAHRTTLHVPTTYDSRRYQPYVPSSLPTSSVYSVRVEPSVSRVCICHPAGQGGLTPDFQLDHYIPSRRSGAQRRQYRPAVFLPAAYVVVTASQLTRRFFIVQYFGLRRMNPESRDGRAQVVAKPSSC